MVQWDQFDVGDDKLMQQLAIRFYCRHLVSLAGWYQAIDRQGEPYDEPRSFCYSGFLMSIREATLLVTAGHIIKDLDEHLREKKIKLGECVIIDGWGLEAKHKQPFPFDYERAPRISVDDKLHGLDFALISLSPFYQKLLNANKVVPISEKNWVHQHAIDFDEHFVLGLPVELRGEIESGDTKYLQPRPAIIPVTKLDDPPDGYETTAPRFVGKIFDNVTLSDMDGTSGGPIIGIATGEDGKRRYWVVAIQSAQLKRQRIVFGCPVPVFAGIIEGKLLQLEKHSP